MNRMKENNYYKSKFSTPPKTCFLTAFMFLNGSHFAITLKGVGMNAFGFHKTVITVPPHGSQKKRAKSPNASWKLKKIKLCYACQLTLICEAQSKTYQKTIEYIPPQKKQTNKETKNKPKTHFSLTSLLSQNRTVIDMYRGRTGISMNVVQFGFHYLTV